MKETPLSQLRYATFAQQRNSVFQVSSSAAPALPLELVHAELHLSGPGAESFSLLFAGPREPVLVQATYSLEHAVIKRFALFIVPVKQNAQSVYYKAIFNREG